MYHIPNSEVPARADENVRLLVPDLGVDPVPGGRRIDKVEALRIGLPALKRRHMNGEWHSREVVAGGLREVLSRSTQTTEKPRSSSGRVALPVAQPTSNSRAPG